MGMNKDIQICAMPQNHEFLYCQHPCEDISEIPIYCSFQWIQCTAYQLGLNEFLNSYSELYHPVITCPIYAK